MNKVSDPIANANGNQLFTYRNEMVDPRQRWVTTLFVQFRLSRSGNSVSYQQYPEQYERVLEQAINRHNGDVVALADDAALAVFTCHEDAVTNTQQGVEAAKDIMAEITQVNRARLAQDLSPLRVAIGLDAGALMAGACNRHPRLDPGLEQFLHKARRLSDLNYQTPFPAMFASRAVVDHLDNEDAYAVQNLGDVFVEGQTNPLVVYAIMDR